MQKNNYLSPWHIFVSHESKLKINQELLTPEIYYS